MISVRNTHLSGNRGCHMSQRADRYQESAPNFGLMLTEDGPKVLEYNADSAIRKPRSYFPRMKTTSLM